MASKDLAARFYLIYLELTMTAVALLSPRSRHPRCWCCSRSLFSHRAVPAVIRRGLNTSSSGVSRVCSCLYYGSELHDLQRDYSGGAWNCAGHTVDPLGIADAVVYSTVLLAAATMIFSGRNFK